MRRQINKKNDFLYAGIADRIQQQISRQLLRPGDKLPSVRGLSHEQGISMSTALKVYAELENRGLIEARPKSGYYVRRLPARLIAVPDGKPPLKQMEQASVAEMIAMVHEHLSEEAVLRLSLATPPLSLMPRDRLSKSMMEAIRNSPTSNLQYEHVQGNIDLRRQVAKNAFNWGGRITEHEVVSTQGCMEALVFCLRAVTRPGDIVAIESPTYFGIFNVMLSLGLKVLEVPVHPDTGIDIEYLARATAKMTISACLFVTNFSNPAGCCMPDERKRQLVALLAARKIPLIEDDIYGDIYFGDSRPLTCKSFDTEGGVLLCSSVSKSLAPGYRVGWCIPGRFKEQIIQVKQMHTISSATPTQAAIAHFFATGRYDLHMRRLRKALHAQRDRYTQAITAFFPSGTRISRPQGGYILWIELDKRINAFDLYRAAMEHKISIAPGQLFSTDARFTHYIRISFGLPFDEVIEQRLKTLGELAGKLLRQAL